MKRWSIAYPECDDNGNIIRDVVETLSEDEILDSYWPWWYEQMIKKHGPDHSDITHENCIDDWIIVNWAWEAKDEST